VLADPEVQIPTTMAEVTQTPSFEAVKEVAGELLDLCSLPVDKYQTPQSVLSFTMAQKGAALAVMSHWKSSLDFLPHDARFADVMTWLRSRKAVIEELIVCQLALYFDAFMLGVVSCRITVQWSQVFKADLHLSNSCRSTWCGNLQRSWHAFTLPFACKTLKLNLRVSLQDPHNEDMSTTGAASAAHCLELARARVSFPGTKLGGKRSHVEDVLGVMITSCVEHRIIARVTENQVQSAEFLQNWNKDLNELVHKFDALPDLAQSGLKELAYFYRHTFDDFADQAKALRARGEEARAIEGQIFELMASHTRDHAWYLPNSRADQCLKTAHVDPKDFAAENCESLANSTRQPILTPFPAAHHCRNGGKVRNSEAQSRWHS
jgi:hypothetical protein